MDRFFTARERNNALTFIKMSYPNATDTEDSAKELLDMVDLGIIKIINPCINPHKITVISGKKFNENYKEEISKALNKIK